ncbi:MAG: hypothetical protein CMH54_04820 [Myxococcales bacterium]|nr:hypothetical protein [Myxococcales bacterium]
MNLPAQKKMKRCGTCRGTRVETYEGSLVAEARLCSECLAPCPECSGSGEVVVNEDGYRLIRQCSTCLTPTKRARMFTKACVPPRYHRSTLASYRAIEGNQGSVRDGLVDYIKNYRTDPRGILLIGDPGVGKTHLLSALIRGLTLVHGVPCRFVEFGQLLSQIKVGYQSGQTEEQIVAPLVSVPVLGIDDMGKGVGSEWEMMILDALISRRYNARRPVLVTTNYRLRDPLNALHAPSHGKSTAEIAVDPIAKGRTRKDRVRAARQRVSESLEDRVGARVASRLGEMCYVYGVEATDFRKKGLI